jgi:hypothetical protein
MAVRVFVYSAQARQAALEISTEKRLEIADQAADIARSTAPVLTGEYQAGVGVRASGTDVVLFDDDPEAGYKEYGTSDTPPHQTLTNAARRFGRYFGSRA